MEKTLINPIKYMNDFRYRHSMWLIHYQKDIEFHTKKTQELLMIGLESFIFIKEVMDAK